MDISGYPSRRTKRLRTLTVWVAVGAILLSLWALWDFWDRRHTIDEACAGLVPPEAVLDLSSAGGGIRGETHEDGTIDLADELPQRCLLYSDEAAEAMGTDADYVRFFSAQVLLEPDDLTWEVDSSFSPFRESVSDTYPDQPIGGGIDGTVTDSGALVRLPCPGGSHRGEEVETIIATAVQESTEGEFLTKDGQMTAADRDLVVRIAVQTVNNLADRLGCEERLPTPPAHVPAVQTQPTPAERADGSCEWYADHLRKAGDRDWLPDQAYESRTGEAVWNEQCLLRVSAEARRRSFREHRGEPALKDFYDSRYRDDVWWARTESFFGEPARKVVIDEVGDSVRAQPGTAGHAGGSHIWWASSVCDGEPAIHTLRTDWPYVIPAAAPLEDAFRAYVRDLAERRGCEQLRFPAHETFTRR